jgi:hypothetical protein
LCAAFFAFYHSNFAYSSDEVWSLKTASLDYSAEMKILKADVHPPLYYQFLYAWVRAVGNSERAVRGLSALFYLASVLSVYGMGRELYGEKIGLIIAAIYLSSPLTILAAQFGRMYALLSLLSVLSTWFYLKLITKRTNRIPFACFIIINILGTFTHIAFFFLLFAEIVFYLVFIRKDLKVFTLAIAGSVLPYLILWAPILLKQVDKSREGLAWVASPNISMARELIVLYGGAMWLLLPALIYFWWRTGFEPLPKFAQLDKKSPPLWLLVITLLTPLVISFAKPIFNPRLAIVGVHLFALTFGAVIGKRANYLLPLGLVTLTLIGIVFLHPVSSSCDNRSIAAHIVRSTKDGDAVIFTGLTRLPVDFYLQQMTPTKTLIETSFPSEIDQHPGYEGNITDPSRQQDLMREARDLAAKLGGLKSETNDRRLLVFRGLHPQIDSTIDQQLREHFELMPGMQFKCEDPSPYFNEVVAYH